MPAGAVAAAPVEVAAAPVEGPAEAAEAVSGRVRLGVPVSALAVPAFSLAQEPV